MNVDLEEISADLSSPGIGQPDEQGWTILHHAVWNDVSPEVVCLIIDQAKISPNRPDPRGNTAMHDVSQPSDTRELELTASGRLGFETCRRTWSSCFLTKEATPISGIC